MKTLYLELSSGISGDMFVAALIDLGVDAHQLEHALEKLRLEGYHLHVKRGHKASLEGVKFDVHLASEHDHGAQPHAHDPTHEPGHTHAHGHTHTHEHGRNFTQIRQLITASQLTDWVKQKSVAVFERLAVAEGRIHGLPPEQVSFHEVGAVDSIVDIVGACIALEMLGKPRVVASPVVEGTGWIECAHGRLPIPAPATLAILGASGIALSQCDEPNELVTPTGAALLAEFVEAFGPMWELVAEKIGYGLGTRDNPRRPNALRAILGESSVERRGSSAGAEAHDWETDTIVVLETNLDDINAEILGNFMEKALAAGALDVFHTAIQMKKSRPGVLLTVLCAEAEADKFSELLVRETSTFGIRRYTAERRKLRREFITVQIPKGSVTMKLGKLDGKVLQAAPEFESCKKLAEQAGVPIKEVYDAALRAFPSSLLK
jgi:uncharacterized protein (TIGR00299 family) protein